MVCFLPISSALSLSRILSGPVTPDVSHFLGHAILRMTTHAVLFSRIQFSSTPQLANSYASFMIWVTSLHFLREAIVFRMSSSFFPVILKIQYLSLLQKYGSMKVVGWDEQFLFFSLHAQCFTQFMCIR